MTYTENDLFEQSEALDKVLEIDRFKSQDGERCVLFCAFNGYGDVMIKETETGTIIFTIDEWMFQDVPLERVLVLDWIVQISKLFMQDFDRHFRLSAKQLKLPQLKDWTINL